MSEQGRRILRRAGDSGAAPQAPQNTPVETPAAPPVQVPQNTPQAAQEHPVEAPKTPQGSAVAPENITPSTGLTGAPIAPVAAPAPAVERPSAPSDAVAKSEAPSSVGAKSEAPRPSKPEYVAPATLKEPFIPVINAAADPTPTDPTPEVFEKAAKKARFSIGMPASAKQRIFAGGVLLVIFAGVAYPIYNSNQARNEAARAQQSYYYATGDLGFPIDSGQGRAIEYMTRYLDVPADSASRTLRDKALNDMMIDGQVPSTPGNVTRRIIGAPTVNGILEQISAREATQRISAIVETTITPETETTFGGEQIAPTPIVTQEEVTYRVPLYADATGRIMIDGNPSLIPNRPDATVSESTRALIADDGELSTSLDNTVFTPFMKAYAVSDSDAQAAYISPDATDGEWRAGLAGSVELVDVSVKSQATGDGTTAYALVTTTWRNKAGETVPATYGVDLQYRDSRWMILDIK